MGDFLIGFTGKDYAIIAADANAARSIMVYSQQLDKIRELDSHKLLAVGGDAANCIRGEKSYNLRRAMSQVDMLLVGYDEGVGPSLYFLDYLASMRKLDYASHGYGGFFCNSLLDTYWRADLTEEQGLELLERCFKEVQTRFMISMPNFTIKVVDKNGVRTVERKS